MTALVKGTTWGTPVLCAATHGVLPKTFTLGDAFEPLPDQPLGVGFETSTELGRESSVGALTGELRYDGQEFVLLAMAMGAAGAPTQIGAVAAYRHVLQLTDGINGLFATMVRKVKSDTVFEFPSVKPASFRIKGGMRIPTEYSIDLLGSLLNQNTGSGTNNNTNIGNVTYRDKRNRIIGDENAYVRINDQSSGGLAASDNIYVSEFELVFSRPMEGDHVLDQTSYWTEPVGTGFTEATLRLTFPQYTDQAATILAALGTTPPTAKKIEIYCQGGVAASGQNFRILIQCPQAFRFEGIPGLDGPGKIPATIPFRLTQANAAPTGMTSPAVTNPFALLLVNTRGTDLLA